MEEKLIKWKLIKYYNKLFLYYELEIKQCLLDRLVKDDFIYQYYSAHLHCMDLKTAISRRELDELIHSYRLYKNLTKIVVLFHYKSLKYPTRLKRRNLILRGYIIPKELSGEIKVYKEGQTDFNGYSLAFAGYSELINVILYIWRNQN